MVSNKRIDRALNGPGFIEVTLGALLGVALGVGVASLYLVLKPVAVLIKPPEVVTTSEVSFVQGAFNSAKARQWTRKHQLLAEGRSTDLLFCEEELNAWMASAVAKTPSDSTKLVIPEQVNFRITGGIIQIGVLGKWQALELSQPLVIQARGKFVPGAAGFVFTADEFYIGSLPLHAVPGLPQWVIQRVLAAQNLPAELTAMWAKLKLVAVEDNALHIVVP